MELTLMIAVGAVLFISIGRAAMTLSELIIDNRDYLVALNIAKWQMTQTLNAAYPAAGAEAAQTADAAFPNFIPTREVSANIATSGTYTIRQITIRVRRGTSAGPVLIRLDTYRSDLITFGNGT